MEDYLNIVNAVGVFRKVLTYDKKKTTNFYVSRVIKNINPMVR